MHLEEFEKKTDTKTKRYVTMRSLMDIGMGILYLGIAGLVFFARQLNFQNEFAVSLPAKVFAALAAIYGAWRIYRGIKKEYYKESQS